ncbi:hypothetical protein V2I59_10815 [Pseudomonas viridiflava]|uniref:hypothetical protein n=1 Tax=Pseudomonas viridiflava TaxID=33069 RepID=UPI002E9A6CDA|nr:hypothetical protein [Pseudomonas viridiflava]
MFFTIAAVLQFAREHEAKVFARWERTYGDAALEFATALATGTLKLTQEDARALLEKP